MKQTKQKIGFPHLYLSLSGVCVTYGASFVPCNNKIHSKNSPVVDSLSLELLKKISSFHWPRDLSAHACVVMKGHLWNPLTASESSGRLLNRSDRVPSGLVRKMTVSPRRDDLSEMNACTCSK
jgi:hypothetical protein